MESFLVSVEGHWTCALTYVLLRRVSLRLLNLDCRYPRDLLQPARKKKSEEILWSTVEVIIQGAVKCATSGVATIYDERGQLRNHANTGGGAVAIVRRAVEGVREINTARASCVLLIDICKAIKVSMRPRTSEGELYLKGVRGGEEGSTGDVWELNWHGWGRWTRTSEPAKEVVAVKRLRVEECPRQRQSSEMEACAPSK